AGSPYGPAASLAISCADAGQGSLTGAWTYTGSVVATVPQDAAAKITETVSVHEAVPLQLASDSGCTCVYNNNCSQTYTYPLVSGQTASTSPTTATDTSGGATTAATTSTSATTSTASTVTTAATTTTNT